MDTDQIFFGLNRASDEKSLASFLRLFCNEKLTDVLIPRLEDDEITHLIDLMTNIMHKHLQEKEYHELFLGEEDPHDTLDTA